MKIVLNKSNTGELAFGCDSRDEIRTSAVFQLVISAVRRLLAGLFDGEQTERVVKACQIKLLKIGYEGLTLTIYSAEPDMLSKSSRQNIPT